MSFPQPFPGSLNYFIVSPVLLVSPDLKILQGHRGLSIFSVNDRDFEMKNNLFSQAVKISQGCSLFCTLLINFSYAADLANLFIHFPTGSFVRALHLHMVMLLALSFHLH